MSPVQAACDFIIDIGDNKAKFVEKFGEPFPQFGGLFMLPVMSTDICPNDNLDQGIAVEYIFLGENLAAIRMVVSRLQCTCSSLDREERWPVLGMADWHWLDNYRD